MRGGEAGAGSATKKTAIIMKKFLFIVCVIVAPALAAAQHPLVNTKAPDFHLNDQYDRPYSLKSFSGRPLVLLASDKDGEDQNYRWKALILDKYKNRIQVAGVADVRAAPFFLKSLVKNNFKKESGSILLDWEGVFFTSYGLTKKVPNVILIDKNGYLRHQYAGPPEQGAIKRLFREIDALK